ncbi:MAG: hypothetical protein QM642_09990, partial [Edaphocola sp.]
MKKFTLLFVAGIGFMPVHFKIYRLMKTLLLAAILAISNIARAQDYNLGFEEWLSSMPIGVNSTDSCSLPINASSIDSIYMLPKWTAVPNGLCRTTDAHSGNYAAVIFMWYNGSTGRLFLGQGCDDTLTSGYDICKEHFSSKIYGLSGYYKYIVDSFMPNDTYKKRTIVH